MGSNVSVIYAILFMAFLELKLYQNVRTIHPEDYAEYLIKAWKRFIDDCFVIWSRKYDLEPFLLMIDSLDNSIKSRKSKIRTIPFQWTFITNQPILIDI